MDNWINWVLIAVAATCIVLAMFWLIDKKIDPPYKGIANIALAIICLGLLLYLLTGLLGMHTGIYLHDRR